jgi:hypothetical protein
MQDRSEGTIYGFFSYRNMPPGAVLRVRILWGKETRREFDAPLSRSDGTGRVVVISFTSQEGGGSFSFGDIGMVIIYNGQEFARGRVGL